MMNESCLLDQRQLQRRAIDANQWWTTCARDCKGLADFIWLLVGNGFFWYCCVNCLPDVLPNAVYLRACDILPTSLLFAPSWLVSYRQYQSLPNRIADFCKSTTVTSFVTAMEVVFLHNSGDASDRHFIWIQHPYYFYLIWWYQGVHEAVPLPWGQHVLLDDGYHQYTWRLSLGIVFLPPTQPHGQMPAPSAAPPVQLTQKIYFSNHRLR